MLAALAALSAGGAQAQTGPWPNRTVRMVIAFPPGGPTDIVSRVIAQQLSTQLGQSVVVDNKPGAGGNIAAELVAKAPADGYTVFYNTSAIVIGPALYGKVNYDTLKDFIPVVRTASVPLVLVVNPQLPARSVSEFVSHARANPGKLNYSSSGTGGLQHMAGELFDYMAKTRMTHVPFKGTAAGVVANLAGEVQVGFGTLFGVRPHMQTGKLRGLAITAPKRSSAVDLPTVAESGVPGYSVDQMYGIIGSAKIPKPIVNKINAGIVSAMKDPETVKRLTADGSVPVGSTPEEYTRIIREEVEKWRKVAKAAGLKLH